jgi:branched-chain amino acid transport system permease protein
MSGVSGRAGTTAPQGGSQRALPGRHGQLTLTALEQSRRLAGPVAGAAALAVLVAILTGGGFASTLILDMLVYAIAAMALDFLGGYAGLISLGNAGFLGVGAYGYAIAEVHSFTPWAAVGVALGVTLGLGLGLGIVAVRVKGITFVIITLAIAEVIWGLAYQWVGLSEGDNGIPVSVLPSIGPFSLSNGLTLRMTVLAVFVVIALLLVTFVRSPFGLSLRGVRSNEARLAALGYRTGLHRYIAWVIMVFFTGVAGILYVFVNQLISPTTIDFSANGLIIIMVIFGGLGSIWGPALGAVAMVLFQQELSIYLSRWQTLLGFTLIAVVLFGPQGLWGLVRAAGRWWDALIERLQGELAGAAGQESPGTGAGPAGGSGDRQPRRRGGWLRGVPGLAGKAPPAGSPPAAGPARHGAGETRKP